MSISTVNLKSLYPQCTREPFSELEYDSDRNTITWWEGKSWDRCEGRWEIEDVKQSRQKKFEIPGIPYYFMIVNKTIYYRKNVE